MRSTIAISSSSSVDPELTINRSPLTQHEMLPAWFWLVANVLVLDLKKAD